MTAKQLTEFIALRIVEGLIGVFLLGRSIHKLLATYTTQQQQTIKKVVMAVLSFILCIALLFGSFHTKTHAVTGRLTYNIFSKHQLHATNPDSKWDILPISDRRWKRVNTCLQRIISCNKASLMRDLDTNWSIKVIVNPIVNAHSELEGKLYIHTGMLDWISNDHELALVIGHEMAHSLLNHIQERVSVQKSLQYLQAVIICSLWFFIPQWYIALPTQYAVQSFLHVIDLPLKKRHEHEADLIGTELAARAGYEPFKAVKFWMDHDFTSHAQSFTAYFAQHPTDTARKNYLMQRLPQMMKIYIKSSCHNHSYQETHNRP